MIKNYRERVSQVQVPNRASSVQSRNLSKLQRTQLEPDKEDFESYQLVQNMIHKGANAEARKGYTNLTTTSGLYELIMYEEIDGNLLYAFAPDSSNTKIISINRSTGATADVVTGISGQTSQDSTSLHGILYFANSNNQVGKYNKQTDTSGTVTINGTETSKLLASDQSRVWCVFKDTNIGAEFLRFSDFSASGAVGTFVQSGTNLDRAGIADSYITNFTALVSAGKYVVACGANRTEVHRIPQFGEVSQPVFTADIGTLVHSFPNLGTESKYGVLAVDENVYINPGDGTIVKINVVTGQKKVYEDNKRQLQSYTHDQTALGYDQDRNLLLIACRNGIENDRVVAFNIREENFSLFTNIFPTQWVQDKDNIYWFNTDQGVFDCFGETMNDDDGAPIPIRVITQATDAGTQDLEKVLHKYYLNLDNEEELTGEVKVYADRRMGGSYNASYTDSFTIGYSMDFLGTYGQPFGFGDWGGAGINIDFKSGQEKVYTANQINIGATRFELEFSTEITQPFKIRGMGLYLFPTTKYTNNKVYS